MGRWDARAPPFPLLPLLIAQCAAKPRWRLWDLLRPLLHAPHVYHAKLLRAAIPWEPQPPPTAAADPLACRGMVVAGPTCRHVPSRGWVGGLARPLVATWRARSGWRSGSLAHTLLSSRRGIRKHFWTSQSQATPTPTSRPGRSQTRSHLKHSEKETAEAPRLIVRGASPASGTTVGVMGHG